MREIFEAELNQLGSDLVELSSLVAIAMKKAGTALLEQDRTVAEAVIDGDKEINELESEIGERCILLLAQQAPVAGDLRSVVIGIRISATLERMGDLAQHIAVVGRGRYPASAVPDVLHEKFVELNAAANVVAQQTTQLLVERGLTSTEEIERQDDILDRLQREIMAQILEHGEDFSTQEIIDATLLARYYERFGDHGVSVAERILYLVTGDFN